MARVGESITDVKGKSEFVESEEKEPVDKAGWFVRRISELGGYENVSDSVISYKNMVHESGGQNESIGNEL